MRDERRNVALVRDRVMVANSGLERLQSSASSRASSMKLWYKSVIFLTSASQYRLRRWSDTTAGTGTGSGLGLNETVDDPAQLFLSRVIDQGERPVGALVGRQLKAVQPIYRSSTDTDRPEDEPSDPRT